MTQKPRKKVVKKVKGWMVLQSDYFFAVPTEKEARELPKLFELEGKYKVVKAEIHYHI